MLKKAESSKWATPAKAQTGQQKISSMFSDDKPSSSRTTSTTVQGSTRALGRFSLEHPNLAHFLKHLMRLDGGQRDQAAASQIVTDISKLLFFCDPKKFDWGFLLAPQMVSLIEVLT